MNGTVRVRDLTEYFFGVIEISFKEIRYKFNKWLDLIFMQLILGDGDQDTAPKTAFAIGPEDSCGVPLRGKQAFIQNTGEEIK